MDESNLIRFFGDNPFNRILDVLVDNLGAEYSKKEIEQRRVFQPLAKN